jgi:selenocysteine lyase/cysteine desulfurase
MSYPALDLATEVHPKFPALAAHPDFTFADNAGGSQILGTVVDAVSSFLIESNVQMGGGYKLSGQAMSKVAEGAEATGQSTLE